MNQTPAPAQTVTLTLSNPPSWFSESTLSGTFLAEGAFLLVPCPPGLLRSLPKTGQLAVTNADGGNEQLWAKSHGA